MTNRVPVIACSRPEGQVARHLREAGIETTVMHLDVDWRPLPDRYALGEGRVAERLTTAEFLRAIVSKTLFVTARDLQSTVAAAVFVVEGEDFPEYSNIHPNAVRGALSALIIEYGASVVCTTDPADSAALIALMARHSQFGVPEISLAAKRRAASPADEQRRVVEMLPGVGFTLARRLLQHFGTIERIFCAQPAELAEVPGISEKTARGIHEVFRREYCAVDFEADIEEVLTTQPDLLFHSHVTVLARQHSFSDETGRRLTADIVFADEQAQVLYIVEIKRGALRQRDVQQLAEYLEAAGNSMVMREYLQRGYSLQGLLVAPDSRLTKTDDERIAIHEIDADVIAAELVRRRLARLGLV